MKIGFIGTGNMAQAIIKGLLNAKIVEGADIFVHSPHHYLEVAEKYHLAACATNQQVIEQADYVVLAVKPYMVDQVLSELRTSFAQEKTVLISLVSGISLKELKKSVGNEQTAIIRVMPNVNAEVGQSITAFVANEVTRVSEYQAAKAIFSAVGTTTDLAEKDFSTFVGIAGSSPAFVYLFIDSLARAGVKHGLSKKQATQIAAQAVLGSAKMLLDSQENPWEMIDKVSSPGGTTVAGLLAMEEAGFITSVVKAVDATIAKDQEKK